jgi:TetR/AcrR family transcriptional regulator, transcriptional repressor of bet genes
MTTHKTTPAQRRVILEALVGIIGRDGISQLTIRKLAQQSGVAVGTVQYYFPTKAAMVRAAAGFAFEEMGKLFDAELVTGGGREQLRRLAFVLLPEDTEDTSARIWLEVAQLSVQDATVACEHTALWAKIEGYIKKLLENAPLRTGLEPGELAAELLALVDGLTITIMTQPERMSARRARRIIDDWLAARLA